MVLALHSQELPTVDDPQIPCVEVSANRRALDAQLLLEVALANGTHLLSEVVLDACQVCRVLDMVLMFF